LFGFLYEGYRGFYSPLSFSDNELDRVVCLYELEQHEVLRQTHLDLQEVLIAVDNKGPYFEFTQNQFHRLLHQYQSCQEISGILFDHHSI